MAARAIKFGTDGWRAVVADDFTYDAVRAVAQGVAWYVGDDTRPLIVGHDSRYCAELFAREVARVLVANDRRVILLDGAPPPPPCPGRSSHSMLRERLWSLPATTRRSSTGSNTSRTSGAPLRLRWWRRSRSTRRVRSMR